MKIKKCPKCGSYDINLYMGGHFGKYICKKCNYIGPLIIEEDVDEEGLKKK